MAYIPDDIILRQYSELSPVAIVLFNYYCAKRNKKTGGWNCPKETVLEEIKGLTSSSYFRAKHELVTKGWVEARRDFIAPLMGFETLKIESSEDEETLKIESSEDEETLKIESFDETETLKNESQTLKNESQTLKNGSLLYKEDGARLLPAHNTSPLNQTQRRAAKAKEPTFEMPEDFSITEEMRSWANEKVPNVSIDDELEEFVSFWRDIATKNNRRTAKGWIATWRERMRQLHKKAGNSPQTAKAGKSAASEGENDIFSPNYKMPQKRRTFSEVIWICYDINKAAPTMENYALTKADFLDLAKNKGYEYEVEDYERSPEFRKRFAQDEPPAACGNAPTGGRAGLAPSASPMPVSR